MSIAVKLPTEFVDLNTLIDAIACAVTGNDGEMPQTLPDGEVNPVALAWAGVHINHESRIRELFRNGALIGRNHSPKSGNGCLSNQGM